MTISQIKILLEIHLLNNLAFSGSAATYTMPRDAVKISTNGSGTSKPRNYNNQGIVQCIVPSDIQGSYSSRNP